MNTSSDLDISIMSVDDNVFGDLDDEGGSRCFDVPMNMAPGEFTSCQFTRKITGTGGIAHVSLVSASGFDENGTPVSDSDEVRAQLIPRLIDLVMVKVASSPTPMNGVARYTLTATNRGPDTATNVQLADPAPHGLAYLEANASQGTCALMSSLVTCSLGSVPTGVTATVEVAARATEIGRSVNTPP